MNYHEDLSAQDVLNAELQTFGALCKYGLFRAVHAIRYNDQRPVVRWRIDRHTSFKQAQPNMYRFPGNPDSGNLPPQYRKLAVLTFDQDQFDDYAERNHARFAVRYRLGKTALMQGVSAEPLFGSDSTDSTKYAVAMGIGKSDLWAEPGVRGTDGNFMSVPDLPVLSQVIARVDLPAGVMLL